MACILHHSAHFRDNSCRFGPPLTLFLTLLAPRRPRDLEPLFLSSCSQNEVSCPSNNPPSLSPLFAGPKYRKPKMVSHDLRAWSFKDGCLCNILHGPLQLQIWTAFLLFAHPFPTVARQSATQLSHTAFSQLSEPTQGSPSTCTLLFPFPARFSTLHCRSPSLAFVLTSTSGLSSL
jgi:hypothetical protein